MHWVAIYIIQTMKKTITLEEAQTQIVSLFRTIYTDVSDELISDIESSSELIHLPKKEAILSVGQVCRSIYFIVDGAVRSYYMDKDGNEITSWLLFESELAISVYSFFSQQPSFEALQTLENTVLLKVNYSTLSELYHKHLEFNFIGRFLTEQYYIRSEAKANALRMLSAKERYLNLLKTRPDIIMRVPLGHLASYLGMNNATLSRIRRSI